MNTFDMAPDLKGIRPQANAMILVARGLMHAATMRRVTARPLLVNAIHALYPLTNMSPLLNLLLIFS